MFSAINSSGLGKKHCGCNNSKYYSPSITNTMDVSFRPIKNTSGTINFIPLLDSKDEIKVPEEMQIDDETEMNEISSQDSSMNYVQTFYIGSITVVGLYILFRILERSK